MNRLMLALGLAMVCAPHAGLADNLYRPDNWTAMAADRQASNVGDILNVLVFENSVASNSAQNASSKQTNLKGSVGAGSHFNETANLGLDGRFNGSGETARSGKIVTQLSVTVEEVLPNGDLRIAGRQHLNINGEKTFINLRGRVRREDIRDNSIPSSRIADAEIDYDGSGFASRSARPGLITRIFNFLGLL